MIFDVVFVTRSWHHAWNGQNVRRFYIDSDFSLKDIIRYELKVFCNGYRGILNVMERQQSRRQKSPSACMAREGGH